MGKKATKKFASSGQLKKVIQARHKHQKVLKKSQWRRGAKGKAEPPEEGKEQTTTGEAVQRFVSYVETSILLISSEGTRP